MAIGGSQSQIQMTLDLEADITDRFRSVKECVAAGVYRRGLKRMAAELDEAPGNLSVQLAGDGQRKLDTDTLELYIQRTGDLTPIRYLVAKYCGDAAAARDEALDRMQAVIAELPALIAASGLTTRRAKGGRS